MILQGEIHGRTPQTNMQKSLGTNIADPLHFLMLFTKLIVVRRRSDERARITHVDCSKIYRVFIRERSRCGTRTFAAWARALAAGHRIWFNTIRIAVNVC